MPVRLATETDAAALIALDSVAEYDPRRAAQIRTWCGRGICYLAEQRGVVMGYGVLHYHFFGCGFIELLMVGERYRRRGVRAGADYGVEVPLSAPEAVHLHQSLQPADAAAAVERRVCCQRPD